MVCKPLRGKARGGLSFSACGAPQAAHQEGWTRVGPPRVAVTIVLPGNPHLDLTSVGLGGIQDFPEHYGRICL